MLHHVSGLSDLVCYVKDRWDNLRFAVFLDFRSWTTISALDHNFWYSSHISSRISCYISTDWVSFLGACLFPVNLPTRSFPRTHEARFFVWRGVPRIFKRSAQIRFFSSRLLIAVWSLPVKLSRQLLSSTIWISPQIVESDPPLLRLDCWRFLYHHLAASSWRFLYHHLAASSSGSHSAVVSFDLACGSGVYTQSAFCDPERWWEHQWQANNGRPSLIIGWSIRRKTSLRERLEDSNVHCVGSVPWTSLAFGEEVNGVSGFVRSYERKDGETETFRKGRGLILCVFSFRNFFFRNEHSPVQW